MSRIHEALKKAQEQRSLEQSVAAPIVTPEKISAPLAPPPQAPASSVSKTQVKTVTDGDFLRYENLLELCSKPTWKPESSIDLFAHGEEGAHGTERLRTLRSRLYQIRATRELKRIVVTSALPAEGKTFITCNLAQVIVRQPDRRVLLIDADMRCPRLHFALGAPKGPGLTEYLRGEARLEEIVQHGGHENLCFIPAGGEVSNPGELAASQTLKKLLQLVTPMFDWVIIDTPPVLPVSDAQVMADHADGVLLVVRAAATHFEDAQKASREFRNKNLLGVVLNQADESKKYGYYSEYYGTAKAKA
jgi:protein-tyrosine kinase